MLFAISLILLYKLSQPATEYSKSQNHWGSEHRLSNDAGQRESDRSWVECKFTNIYRAT